MQAGDNIRAGHRTIGELEKIGKWKAPRATWRLQKSKNVFAVLSEACNDALADEKRLEAVLTLSGVGIPVTSAILTCIDVESFTVIDRRALDAIGAGAPPSRDDKYSQLYLKYLKFCRSERDRMKVTLRQLDRALWKAGTII